MKKIFLTLALALGIIAGASAGSRVQFSYNEGTMEAADDYLGLEQPILYRAGIKIDDESLIGYKVLGLRADYIRNDGNGLKNITIWNSERMRVNAEKRWTPDVVEDAKITGSTLEGYFSEPITLTEDGLYLGYGFEVETVTNSTAYPIAYGTPAGTRHSCYIVTRMPAANIGDVIQDASDAAGPLMITVYMEAPQDLPDALTLKSVVGRARSYTNTAANLSFKVINGGTGNINSIDYTYTLEGQTTEVHKELTTPIEPVIGRMQQVTLNFRGVEKPGAYPVDLTINKINGVDNPATEKSLTFDLNVSDAGISFDPTKTPTYVYGDNAKTTMGSSAKTTYNIAVDANLPALKGLKIVGAKATGIPEENMGSFTIWASNKLDTVASLETVDVDLVGNEIIGGFHNPPVVDGNDLYIGYSMEVLHLNMKSQTPVPYVPTKGIAGSFWLSTNEVGWQDMSDTYGSATITLYVDGDISANAAALGKLLSSNVLVKDKPFTLRFELVNAGTGEISNVDYTYSVDNKTVNGNATLEKPIEARLGAVGELSVDVEGVSTPGLNDFNLTIDKVNSQVNPAPAKQATYRLIIPSFYPTKRPLMEEATGTWCGWCPRGMVGMRELTKEFPEFIGAAYHNNDPMMVTEDYPWAMDGYPSAAIDRKRHLCPFYGSTWEDANKVDMGIRNDYLEACKLDAPADIEIDTKWNDDKSLLAVTSTIKFAQVDDNEQYRIGYLLVEDGLSHPESDAWAQNNTYADFPNTPGILQELAQRPKLDHNYEYNDVVIEAKTNRGIDGSLPEKVNPDVDYTHSYVFDTKNLISINDNKTNLAEDPDAMSVIVILMNRNARVLNARKVKAGEKVGVNNIITDSEPTAEVYYDLQGRRVQAPQHGIFIRQQGSTTEKVIL